MRPAVNHTVQAPSSSPVESTGLHYRVWMIHPVPDIDITDANRFGEVCYVSPTGRYLFGDQVDDLAIPDFMQQEMQSCVDNFDPEKDFLLLAGDHAQLVILGAMLAARHGRFNMLRYDRFNKGYFPIGVKVWIDLDGERGA